MTHSDRVNNYTLQNGCVLLTKKSRQFLLVEPVAKTPYPPLGLMKLATYLKKRRKPCEVFATVGKDIPHGVIRPLEIYLTTLFTWDLKTVVNCIHFYADRFPRAKIHVGGIAASLVPEYITSMTGIVPHKGLLHKAEAYPPDYSFTFNRKLNASITFTSRGCVRRCRFCNVSTVEPDFYVKSNWQRDVALTLPRIVFWDNNWLASPNFSADCDTIESLGKQIDFNQGLDARLYNQAVAKRLSSLRLDPIRFAFDYASQERHIMRAINLAKKYAQCDIRVYVLYNFKDTPEDFFNRILLLNERGVLAFPMEYRRATPDATKFPGPHWNTQLLRALKLSLIFYYRKGMITKSHKSFRSIYGKTPKQFVSKLYQIYEYDKSLKS